MLDPDRDQSGLLAKSAELLRTWLNVDEETQKYLSTQNDFDVSLCIFSDGPKYILMNRTAGVMRLSNKAGLVWKVLNPAAAPLFFSANATWSDGGIILGMCNFLGACHAMAGLNSL